MVALQRTITTHFKTTQVRVRVGVRLRIRVRVRVRVRVRMRIRVRVRVRVGKMGFRTPPAPQPSTPKGLRVSHTSHPPPTGGRTGHSRFATTPWVTNTPLPPPG